MKSLAFLLFSLLCIYEYSSFAHAFSIDLPSFSIKCFYRKPVSKEKIVVKDTTRSKSISASPWYAPWHELGNGNVMHLSLHRETRHEVHRAVSRKSKIPLVKQRRHLLQATFLDEDLAPELSPTGSPKPFTMPKDTYVPMNSTKVIGSPFDIGEYFARVALGTPPSYFNLSIATARDYLWVPCRCKTNCGTADGALKNFTGFTSKTFDPTKSTSFLDIPCGSLCTSYSLFSNAVEKIKCGESRTSPGNCGFSVLNSLNGTANGDYSSDIFQFYAPKKIVRARLRFGCASKLTNNSYYPQGVLGLGRGGSGTYPQMFQTNQMKNFWLCFESDVQSITPGYIGFNYTQTNNFTLRSSVAPLLSTANGTLNNSPFYAIVPMDFYVALNTIYPKLESLIIDSGRSMTNLPRDVYDNFLAAVEAESGYTFLEDDLEGLNCTTYKENDDWYNLNLTFPTSTLTFEYQDNNNNLPPYTWTILPHQYLQQAVFDPDYFCLAMTSNPGYPVIGSKWMQDKFIQFDLQSKKVWWMDMNCTEGKQIEIITDYGPVPSPPVISPPSSDKSAASPSSSFPSLLFALLVSLPLGCFLLI